MMTDEEEKKPREHLAITAVSEIHFVVIAAVPQEGASSNCVEFEINEEMRNDGEISTGPKADPFRLTKIFPAVPPLTGESCIIVPLSKEWT
tara:strand:+ start:153 stop:425 length:273 start_codon:yes stop_codon:yes gene_type:complete